MGATFEWIGQNDQPQAGVPVVGRNLMGEADELVGDDHHRGLLQAFDRDGVVDTPRGARSSIAEADHAHLDET